MGARTRCPVLPVVVKGSAMETTHRGGLGFGHWCRRLTPAEPLAAGPAETPAGRTWALPSWFEDVDLRGAGAVRIPSPSHPTERGNSVETRLSSWTDEVGRGRIVVALALGFLLAAGVGYGGTGPGQVTKANPALVGFSPAAGGGIGAAMPQSPACGAELHNFPRVLNTVWTAAPGANRYEVEIDCLYCTQVGKWDSEIGASKHLGPITGTSTTYTFPGDNDGRWRVRGLLLVGGGFNEHRYGPWSDWCKFRFKTGQQQPPPTGERPCVGRPCADITNRREGIVIGGAVGGTGGHFVPWNNSVTLGEAEAIGRSNGQCAFNVHYEMTNIGPLATAPAAPPATGPRFTNRLRSDATVVSQQTDLYLNAGQTTGIDTQAYLTPGGHTFSLALNDGFTVPESNVMNNSFQVKYLLNGTCNEATRTLLKRR